MDQRTKATVRHWGLLVGGAFVLASGARCTDAGLQPYQPPGPPALDNKLRVEAHVCTTTPVDDVFPVKVLFLVDTSDSMSVTDRGQTRVQAVVDVLNRYAGDPSVEFAVVAFDSVIDVLTDGFTNSPDLAKISARLSMADRLTDYEGALGTAYTLLSQDMAMASPADRARSKYVVIFFSDGTPDPQCSATGMSQDLVCTVPREQWQSAFDPPLDPSLYPELQAGGDYNQPPQIYQKVDQIVALQDFYRVGEVRLHTAFLFNLAAAMDPLAAPFHLNRMAGEQLLTAMAMHGGGTFTEFNSGGDINFLNFDYASIQAQFALANFIAVNTDAIARHPAPTLDTDGDGLDDATEFQIRTCVGPGPNCGDPTDSDGDGFSDFIENAHRGAGFDPLDPKKPTQGCKGRGDSDGDGLRDCEELFLGTDPRLFDTDGDRIPDLVEVVNGLDPLDPTDAWADPDHDGIFNIDEVRLHLEPFVPDLPTDPQDNRYAYDFGDAQPLPDGRACYDLAVHDIRMLTTGSGTQAMLGRNRILLYFDEALADQPQDYGKLRVACVDTRYVDGALKAPPSGVVHLTDSQFVSPTKLNLATDCIDLTSFTPAPDGGAPGGP